MNDIGMSLDPAIEVDNLSVSYPNSPTVLEDCNFTLNFGELAVLSGYSGQGKSTLMSCINGIIPNVIHGKMFGEVRIGGVPTSGLKMSEISRQVGSVLQNPDSQIFHEKVIDEIAFGCENLNIPSNEIDTRVNDSCNLFSLDRDANTKTLSGGQKQRLMVACAYAMGQKILLLDEPLANLDLEGSKLLLETLRRLCKKGYAVFLIEHRLDIVLPYADRTFAFDDKALIEVDTDGGSYDGMRKIVSKTKPLTEKKPIISIDNLIYSVQERNIIDAVSLDIYRGERIVVIGENGCGKTTLLKLIAGLTKPSSGRIDVDIDAKPGSKKWFQSLGYVYQEPSYQLFMPTVRDEVCANADGLWGERCMVEFRLKDLAGRHPQSLSEGQKRRVSIAATLSAAHNILLLDEPTVGQDYGNLESMVHTLNAIPSETGNTMITITHDYRCAEALADRVLWLKGGAIYESGSRELIERYYA